MGYSYQQPNQWSQGRARSQQPLVRPPGPPSTIPAAPGSAAAAARMNPNGTSSPKRYVMPELSPISDANDSNTSKLNIIAPETSLDVSSILARTVNSSSSLEPQVETAGIAQHKPVPLVVPPGDPNDALASQELNIPLPDPQDPSANAAPGNLAERQELEAQQPAQPDNANGNIADDAQQPQFPENTARLPYLSHPRRITLAYKYYPFPARPDGPVREVSEARGSDEDRESRPSEIAHNSFPMSNFILRSWQTRGRAFQDVLQNAIAIDPETVTSENTVPTNVQDGQDNSGNKDQFMLYSEKFGSILKTKPEKQQQNFYYHVAKFGDYVQADMDIGNLRKPEPKDPVIVNNNKKDEKKFVWRPDIHLNAEEIKNIQLACAYSLHAESHASAYVRASRCAINEVLSSLDPAMHPANINKLKDVKYMLQGVVSAIEQNVAEVIYIHSGLTAQMRSDFLAAQGDYLPMHVKQKLLHEHFGGSGLFNSAIGQYVDEIARHNAKQGQKNLETAVNQALQPAAPSTHPPRGYLGMPRIPRIQGGNSAPQQQQQHNNKSFNKRKFNKSKPRHQQHPGNRGGTSKGPGAGRGNKSRN